MEEKMKQEKKESGKAEKISKKKKRMKNVLVKQKIGRREKKEYLIDIPVRRKKIRSEFKKKYITTSP